MLLKSTKQIYLLQAPFEAISNVLVSIYDIPGTFEIIDFVSKLEDWR